jgi:sugar phosphate isomerase/epimerase
LKEQLGLLSHRAHLEKNAARLLGFHLHDTTPDGRDHQPIGAGGVDFAMVGSFWKPHHLLVLELGPRVSAADVIKSKNKIEALMRGAGLMQG